MTIIIIIIINNDIAVTTISNSTIRTSPLVLTINTIITVFFIFLSCLISLNASPKTNINQKKMLNHYFFTGRNKDYTKKIENAMKEYHDHTCIRFKRRRNEADYVEIEYGDG